jgi:catechol-2,3-dioxygenase
MSDVNVKRLSHVGLTATSVDKQAEFYTDRWGLDRIDEADGTLYLRGDGGDHHCLTLRPGEPGLDYVAFEVGSTDELERAVDKLHARGLEITVPPAADLEPGIARALRFKDPDGNTIELYAGMDVVPESYGPRDVKPRAVNHVVFHASDRQKMEQFYADVLGFKLSDNLNNFMTFWRCNANHHSIALVGPRPDGKPGLQHIAFELQDHLEWLKGIYSMGEHHQPPLWGPGRHLAGNNLFAYFNDPEGNRIEYTAEVEQITDPNYQPHVYLGDDAISDVWSMTTFGGQRRAQA